MNSDQWIEAVRIYNDYWPNQQLPPGAVKRWSQHLAAFNADTVYRALGDLVETSDYAPTLAKLHEHCVALRNHHIASTTRRELPPFPHGRTREERDWDRMTDDQREQWVAKAASHWRDLAGFPIKDDSPILVASAAAMARGVSFTPPPVGTDRYHRCGCGAVLLAIDPPGKQCRNCEGSGRKATM